MSDFGEELSSLMAKKTISAENLCQMAELNPAYLEKLKCGKLLPSNYGVVKKISEVLGLVPEEEYQLWNSYKVSKLGEKHMCTEEALKALFALPAARPQRVPGEINAVSLQNGVPICGRERVYQAIRQLLRESTDSADLLLHVERQEFCRILGEEIWEKGADYRCRLLLYLREERMAEKNVASFGMLVQALLSGRIEVHYNYIVAEKLVDYILFPFLIRTEQALLLLNQDLSAALYLDEPETVAIYGSYFQKKYGNARQLCAVFESADRFIRESQVLFAEDGSTKPMDFYILSRKPCVIFENDEKIVREHVCAENMADGFVENYMTFLYEKIFSGVKKMKILFCRDGMTDFLNSEEFHEFHPTVDKPIPKAVRQEFFGKMIRQAQENDNMQLGLLENALFTRRRHCINLWSTGKMLLMFDFEDSYRLVLLQENTIVSAMIEYFRALRKAEAVRTKEETLEIMQQELDAC